MRAVRPTREVGILSLAIALPPDLRAGDDVIGAVRPAHPRLLAAVVVVGQEDQRRRLAERDAGLRALGVEPAPDADERVVLALGGDGARLGVTGVDPRLGCQLKE